MPLARAKYLGIIKEAGAWGTGGVPTTFLEFLTCNVKKTVEKIQSAVNINARYPNDIYPGSIDIGGSFDIEVNPDNIGLLMYMALGVEAAQAQVTGSAAEVTEITCVGDTAGSLSGCYWLLEAPGITEYYVWYDVAGMGSTDPALTGKYGIVCGIAIDANANAVATATATAIVLASAIRLANDLKAKINASFADVAAHTTAPDPNTIASPNPITLVGLIALVTEMLTDYDAHDDDAELGIGWAYHAAQEAGEHTLASVVAPVNIGECVTRLLDIKAKYNGHDADDTCHGIGSYHQTIIFHDFDAAEVGAVVTNTNQRQGSVTDASPGDTGWAAGNFVVTTPGSGGLAYDHVFTMAPDGTDLDSFVLEVGKEIKQMRYAGVMVNTLTLTAAKGSILKATFGVLGKSEDDAVGVPGGIVYSQLLPYVFDLGEVKIDDAVVGYVKSFELTLDNLLDADGYRLDGTNQRGSLNKQGITVSGTMTIEYVAGSYAQRTAYIANTTKWLTLIFTSTDTIEPAYYYTMTVDIKYVKYTESNDDIGGRDAIPLVINWVAKAPAAGQEFIKVTLRDALAAKWSA